jgi:hypothetical protein
MAGGMKVVTKPLRLGDVKLLPVNARFMRHETFRTLVDNIRRDGTLTSAPFAVLDGDGYLVLSGNHRVKAGIEALGPDHTAEFLVTDDELSAKQRTAIQLSHNALVGEDDPVVLRQLYEQLDAIDWRAYSGLDDKQLDLIGDVKIPMLAEQNLDYQPVTLTFLPDEVTRAEAAWAEASQLLQGTPVWLARWADHDHFLDALAATARAHDIHNIATALMLMLEVFRRHQTDLADGFLDELGKAKHDGWVPLSAIFGSDTVPAKAAAILHRAVARMKDEGHVSEHNLVGALELWAADYLAS